jgi:hypothetical protein
MSDDVEYLLVGRLWEFLGPDYDPWNSGFVMKQLDADIGHNENAYGETAGWYDDWDAKLHAQRIKYIAGNEKILNDPIQVDNYCWREYIMPYPVILDGNHRFMAHVWKKLKVIPATYGGRVDILEYLTGKSDVRPVDDVRFI